MGTLFLAHAEVPAEAPGEEVRVQIDWQAHPAMHIPWKMFGRGLTHRELRRRTWRHQLRQTVSQPTLGGSEVRIFLAAAMAAERARNPRQARRLILKQLKYVEDFADENSDDYAIATSPAEARALLSTTKKMVIIHSIEGGHHLLWQPDDAQFWADQGVALVTLIHLRDRELGGADILEGGLGPVVNRWGTRAARKGERRGLTDLGKASIVALDAAGILVDYAHMSPASLEDALQVSAAHQIPPVLTHNSLDRVRRGEFSITDAQLVEIYRLGGVFSVALTAGKLTEEAATGPAPEGMCWQTLEAWAWQHNTVQQTILDNVGTIFGDPELDAEELTEAQWTRLATGWSSDWNGWVSHSLPVHGRKRCRPEREDMLDIDTRGLAHPGLLPEHWQRVAELEVDFEPMLRSSERFLQLWAEARGE